MEVIITIELYMAAWSRVTSHGSPRHARKSLLLSELMLPPKSVPPMYTYMHLFW